MEKNISAGAPILIGLAGTSCSGKNTAAFFLQEMGFYIIDADLISKKIFEAIQTEIIQAFKKEAEDLGVRLESKNGQLDKKSFAEFVFSDAARLKKHEDIIMPRILNSIETEISTAFNENPLRPVVLNAPTLHKTPFLKKCRFIIYIDAPEILRFLRAKKRDGLSFKQIAARFSRQKDFFSQYFFPNADTVRVVNMGSTAKLKRKLERELKKRGF